MQNVAGAYREGRGDASGKARTYSRGKDRAIPRGKTVPGSYREAHSSARRKALPRESARGQIHLPPCEQTS